MVIRAFYINISVNNLYVKLANRDNYFPVFPISRFFFLYNRENNREKENGAHKVHRFSGADTQI